MNIVGLVDKERIKKDTVKDAVAFALSGNWSKAVNTNQSIIDEFPLDVEAYNRLGKAYSELGHNDQALKAFKTSLGIKTQNDIAKKNIERLENLAQNPAYNLGNSELQVSIEESGQTTVTQLINLAPPSVIRRLAPGNKVSLKCVKQSIKITLENEEYVGQIEPKLATRLNKLISGGNRYQANVTRVNGEELVLMIKEIFRDPSQSNMVSFPSAISINTAESLNEIGISKINSHQHSVSTKPVVIKDWSNDDTEPGDDNDYSLGFDRIVSEDDESIGNL